MSFHQRNVVSALIFHAAVAREIGDAGVEIKWIRFVFVGACRIFKRSTFGAVHSGLGPESRVGHAAGLLEHQLENALKSLSTSR